MSDWTEASGKVSDKVDVPTCRRSPSSPRRANRPRSGKDLAVWAFPEIVEVDPVTGLPMFEKDRQAYRQANPVWSGEEGKVRLAAGRGEIVAFQLALENAGKPLRRPGSGRN